MRPRCEISGLARISHTVVGVTEANLPTGQEKTAERIGNTVKGFDAACRQIRPALRVTPGGPSGASNPSTVAQTTLFGLLLPDRQRPSAMTRREGVRSSG